MKLKGVGWGVRGIGPKGHIGNRIGSASGTARGAGHGRAWRSEYRAAPLEGTGGRGAGHRQDLRGSVAPPRRTPKRSGGRSSTRLLHCAGRPWQAHGRGLRRCHVATLSADSDLPQRDPGGRVHRGGCGKRPEAEIATHSPSASCCFPYAPGVRACVCALVRARVCVCVRSCV